MATKDNVIGIKQLHKELPRVARSVLRGCSFVVLKHANPLFRIEPINPSLKMKRYAKKYTLQDLAKIRFRSKEHDLSQRIDEIAYEV
jgi:antitoxin (DNA-binding transcriptional repressor) of toxin-antitoxin stability system